MFQLKNNLSTTNFLRLANLAWIVYIVVICIFVWFQGQNHSVTPDYYLSSDHWILGQQLYNTLGVGFIYLPQSAILFTPLALIAKYSFVLAEIIWRILSLGIFMVAVFHFTKLLSRININRNFLIVTLLIFPLAFSSARNGQFNIILSALMLLAVSAINDKKWWLTALYLLIGFALKPTMIVLLLLAFATFPKLRLRLLAGMALLFLLPFITQSYHYVFSQYIASLHMLFFAANRGITTHGWAQLFAIFYQLNIAIPDVWQEIIRIICALLVLILSWRATRTFKSNAALIFIYTFTAIYLMLLNPRTEHNDYVILAPALGAFTIWAFAIGKRYLGLLLVCLVLGIAFAGHYTLSQNIHREYWSAPFLTIIFTFITFWFYYRKPKSPDSC